MNSTDLLSAFKTAPYALSLGEVLKLYPLLSRRTAQRWISELIVSGVKA